MGFFFVFLVPKFLLKLFRKCLSVFERKRPISKKRSTPTTAIQKGSKAAENKAAKEVEIEEDN